MKLTSAGAARTVTGSCHLIETRDRRILVDCGMFQGTLAERNREPFPFDPETIDAVVLTHGHLDHCGRLPLLLRRGFEGPIHAVRSTRAIADIILQDSAKIQEEDHDRAVRKARERGDSADDVPPPLYVPGDVAGIMLQMRDAQFDEPADLGGGVSATFRPAGHILGSAFVEIETPDARIVASGDLGNRESVLQEDFALPSECDAVLVETTYADRVHRPQEATEEEFREVLRDSVGRGGMVMIPSFAVERTQTVLYQIRELMHQEAIPPVPVFLDSPMATKMTRLYRQCANEFRAPIADALERGEDPFEPPTLEYARTVEDSKRINDVEGGAIVIAGSGMMSGGRIVHHLLHHLHERDSSLVIVSYQAEGTLGRRIVDGARTVPILGRDVDVRSKVATINGLSAHADRDDLLAWLEGTGDATAYLVHGEIDAMQAFVPALEERGRDAVIVEHGRTYEIG